MEKLGTLTKSYTKVNQQASRYIPTKSVLPRYQVFWIVARHWPATRGEFQIFHIARRGLHPRASQVRPSYFTIKMHPIDTVLSLVDSVRQSKLFDIPRLKLNQRDFFNRHLFITCPSLQFNFFFLRRFIYFRN